MNRQRASELTRAELNKHGLTEWGVRLTTDANQPFLGMCSYRDKVIILNAHHIDLHGDAEVVCTIKHEVAHALTPGHAHDNVWADKAKEIGCDNTLPCSHLSFPDHVIDAIRSGATIELEIEEEHHVIRKPKYTIKRLQDNCPECGKVAEELFNVEIPDREGNICRMITLKCFHIIKKIIPKGTPFETFISNGWRDDVKTCKHQWATPKECEDGSWQPNQCVKCEQFKLRDFQVVGCRAAESGLATQKGFGIFDDMGLGKTMQGLGIIRFHDEYTPTLYIVKSALTFQWFKAIVTWLGPTYLPQIIRTGKDKVLPGLKSYIISYDLLRRFPREKLDAIGIKLIMMDECQQIKNPDSSRTQEVRRLVGLPGVKVLPLSGTPWKNRGEEFFPVLNMIDPIKFHSLQRYLDDWVEFYWEGNKKKQGGIKNPKKFREFVANLIIRREYDEVMEKFPVVNRAKLNIELDELAQSAYDDEVSDFAAWYNEKVIGGEEESISGIELLGKMARMRHITGLAKIPATLSFVESFVEDTERKLVIFVHHKDVGEYITRALSDTSEETNKDWCHLAKELILQGIKVLQYTSKHTGKPEGFDRQEEFNTSKRAIMIASTLACGEGLNLQTCADSILHERQWNPQNEEQATPGRFKRIGQLSNLINNTIIEANGTIDEHIGGLVEGKRGRFHAVMNKGQVATYNETEFARELAKLIVQKHKQKTGGKKSNITSKAKMPNMQPVMAGW